MITEGEWQAFMDVQKTVDRFDVPAAEQRELVAIVESTKDAIVNAPLKGEPPATAAGAAIASRA